MSLADDLGNVESIPYGVTDETKNQAFKDLVDYYRQITNSAGEPAIPLLARALAGETTIYQEFERLGESGFLLAEGNIHLIGGNYDMEKAINRLDEVIKDLYM
ncbi:hypothetical protein GOV03_04865 [Candidatus Woesearchaeota archaeon]|nr:hypothetical protein [Candidatus Woesearchaeota archaeon]